MYKRQEFTNEVIESIRNGNSSAMTKFRDKYRTVDVLMIDDIQFIIGKAVSYTHLDVYKRQVLYYMTFKHIHNLRNPAYI